jgi:hypothetical protein
MSSAVGHPPSSSEALALELCCQPLLGSSSEATEFIAIIAASFCIIERYKYVIMHHLVLRLLVAPGGRHRATNGHGW